MTKAAILEFLRSHKDEMRQRFGLVTVGLFGSYVRGEATEKSDIDLMVELRSENTFRSFFGLKAYLEDALQKKVDMGTRNSIKPIVFNQIKEEIEYA